MYIPQRNHGVQESYLQLTLCIISRNKRYDNKHKGLSLSLLSGEFNKGGPVGIHFSVKRASRKHIFCGVGRKYGRLPTHTHTHTHTILCLLSSHIKTIRDQTSEKKTEKGSSLQTGTTVQNTWSLLSNYIPIKLNLKKYLKLNGCSRWVQKVERNKE